MGNGVVAALQAGFDFAVGLDRSLSEFAHNLVGPSFPELCTFYGVDLHRTLLIEGNPATFRFANNSLECVMTLDVIEHVDDPRGVIQYAYRVTSK